DKSKNGTTIKHDGGTTNIDKKPKRVVALEFSFVDALAALDIKPVGVADDGKKERILAPIREKIGDYQSVGARKQPNLVEIINQKQDIINADSNRHSWLNKYLDHIDLSIMVSNFDNDYKEILDGFKIIAKATDQEDKEKDRLKHHNELMDKYKKEI